MGLVGSCLSPAPLGMMPTLKGFGCLGNDAGTHRSFGYSSLKSRLFRVVQSRIFSILMTMSLPCQRPFHSCRETGGHCHCEGYAVPEHLLVPHAGLWGPQIS